MSNKTYTNTGYNSTPTAPPLPLHADLHSTDQGFKEVSMNSPSPFSEKTEPPLYRLSNQSTPSPLYGYDSDDDDLEKIIPKVKKKRSCIDKTCCGCCTCCPKWLRWCTCILFLLILALAIVVGVLAGMFKVPDVQFTGLEGTPIYGFENNVLNMQFNVGIRVDNPNFESITFQKIKADAYYPPPYNVYIGGGNITDQHIRSNGITDISFPFSINLNSTDANQQGVLMDLVTRCGLDGSAPQGIKFNYNVRPTVNIIGIPITIKISKSMTLDCPTSELNSILGGLFNRS